MILALDTSALIKRYISEDDSETIQAIWTSATHLSASWILEAEMLATFARKRREGIIPATDLDAAERHFLTDWLSFIRVEPYRVSMLLPGLHRAYSLRGADSIHLASTILLRTLIPNETITFATADQRLATAANVEGLVTLP